MKMKLIPCAVIALTLITLASVHGQTQTQVTPYPAAAGEVPIITESPFLSKPPSPGAIAAGTPTLSGADQAIRDVRLRVLLRQYEIAIAEAAEARNAAARATADQRANLEAQASALIDFAERLALQLHPNEGLAAAPTPLNLRATSNEGATTTPSDLDNPLGFTPRIAQEKIGPQAATDSVISLRYLPASDMIELVKQRLGVDAAGAINSVTLRANTIRLYTLHRDAERVSALVQELDRPQPPLIAETTLPASGVGIVLREHDGGIFVESVHPGTPADGHIKKGDRLISVLNPGHPLVKLEKVSIGEVIGLIRGAEGSSVTLVVVREGKTGKEAYEVTLVRKRIFGTGTKTTTPAPANGAEKSLPILPDEKIVKLARERLAVVRARFEAGYAPMSEVIEAEGEVALAKADGDPFKKAEARLTIAAKTLQWVETRHTAGLISEAELSRAKQRLQEAEIDLQRVKGH